MKRRGFLVAAAAFAAAPVAASTASAHPSSPRLPKNYLPLDVQPYFHPSVLTSAEVDELIWPAVRRINESGWVWTLESCQGDHAWSQYPLIRLICHHGNASRMLGLLHRSALPGVTDAGPSGVGVLPRGFNTVSVARHVKPTHAGWFEARTLVKGPHPIRVFDRFADAVNTGHVRGGGI